MTDSLLGPDARPSDDDPAVIATGQGDALVAVMSMTRKTPDGTDAAYLRWHLLDHLTEQYRIAGFRGGQRWVSTPACRAARAVSQGGFEDVDHIVHYLFAEPLDDAARNFYDLGVALQNGNRMPASSFAGAATSDVLPKVLRHAHVGAYDIVGRVASRAALVGAAVVPWRPGRGVYVLIERAGASHGATLDTLVDVPGVAGMWRYRGVESGPFTQYDPSAGLAITVFYLDQDPVQVAGELGGHLTERWADQPDIEPLLAAPFELVLPWQWDRALP